MPCTLIRRLPASLRRLSSPLKPVVEGGRGWLNDGDGDGLRELASDEMGEATPDDGNVGDVERELMLDG